MFELQGISVGIGKNEISIFLNISINTSCFYTIFNLKLQKGRKFFQNFRE